MLTLNSRRPRSHLIIPDPHAHPDFNNNRADYLGKLIIDLKPDVVVNLGDCADMPSLASYDKGKRAYHGRSYRKDIDATIDFNERMWGPVRARKKKLPLRVIFEGNHEERIERALDMSPELQGAIGFEDLKYDDYYDHTVRYVGQTPGVAEIDGVHYAHFMVSGIMGRAIGGEHPAYSLLTKEFTSCTVGHSHVLDYCERTIVNGKKIHGLVAGVYQDFDSPWAGEVNKLWWRGVIHKRYVQNGSYDVQFISLDTLKKEYGK